MTQTALTPTLQALATEARAINAANGWGLSFKFEDVPGYLALVHSEVTEAYTAGDVQGAARELGDVIVRALDLAELLAPGQIQPPDWPDTVAPTDLYSDVYGETGLLGLHVRTSEILEVFRKEPDEATARAHMVWGLHTLARLAAHVMVALPLPPEVRAWDPTAVVQEILAANRQRAYRHGGRRS
jgi:hypothetical protein